ncbi:MAG TPA: hypothetical protein VN706_03140 [Gemmatimonadaceae bacterium]|nr:hypothetical protein [Gemmatimonadaceae bacterium]
MRFNHAASATRLLLTCAAATVFTTACASGSAGAASESASAVNPAADVPHRDRNTILAEDMHDLTVTNLYDAVQRLHPEWLNPRNSSSIGRRSGLTNEASNDIQVYIDTQRAGNTDMLKSMALSTAVALKFYSASEAQARFGTGNLNGVIQVVMTK